jgi:hypothetical protein
MTRVLLLPAALLLASLSACDPSDACDPGYTEIHGTCYPNPQSMPANDGGNDPDNGLDTDAGDDVTADAGPAGDPYEGFGDACEDQSDCPDTLTCGAPQLALCTQVNCLEDPSICPPDWTCLDTTGISPDPSVTSVCLML